MASHNWHIWIDTGGTFTDCIAVTPDGRFLQNKVLSSGALRGKIKKITGDSGLAVEQSWEAPDDFIKGFSLNIFGTDHRSLTVTAFDAEKSIVKLHGDLPSEVQPGSAFEVISDTQAPILAARLITKTGPGRALPAAHFRLGTTKGTNTLLERKGAPTLLLITEGFGDLLRIGDQKRPDLFAVNIQKTGPLYTGVIEVPERLEHDGTVLRELNSDELVSRIREVAGDLGQKVSVAVCLMNSYVDNRHEKELEKLLGDAGIEHLSVSSDLSPFIKIINRAETAVVNAYLKPVMDRYLEAIADEISGGGLRLMTSAGGLVTTGKFNPKDSLLSGPAGGVVGASAAGEKAGYAKVISFDMGGTSTDVARYDDGFSYVFEHTVGQASLSAPALSIETVAAGGGSICYFDGFRLRVGPESAGAKPGPACYGAGGPLTITDVNLLLGRLMPENFSIPISEEAAHAKLVEVMDEVKSRKEEDVDEAGILEGFLEIANERMADAINKISLRKGYDPQEYALVAFGGAGAQHACALADLLNIGDIVIPENAGLLSAEGLGSAAIEQFAEKQVLQPLEDVESGLDELVGELEKRAANQLATEVTGSAEVNIRRRLFFMRLAGQDSTLEVNYEEGSDLRGDFMEAYRSRYGHWIEDREIEVESVRVIASTARQEFNSRKPENTGMDSTPKSHREVIFGGKEIETPIYSRGDLSGGTSHDGPAVILDPYSTIVLEPGWAAARNSDGALILSKNESDRREVAENGTSEAVELELFTNRFTSIADEMGAMLKRTALSVNIKERMDFSCALLDPGGNLVVNAPHIPVHLGALGICVRTLMDTVEFNPGDVVVTNHPAYGGSHLPDITVVTPVFDRENRLIAFAANRAHHAEIGGTRPGSMPPDARTLAEEGVVIPPFYLVRDGEARWDEIRRVLSEAPYPARNVEENIADLQAAVAANHRGSSSLLNMVEVYGRDKVTYYMNALKKHAASKMQTTIGNLQKGAFDASEYLDDGTRLAVKINITDQEIHFDFEGTDEVHPGNLNATRAIVHSVLIYVLRLLINEPLPLNEGILEPVTINLPEGLLNPGFVDDPKKCPAVVGGNVETSQRLVDLLLKPFEIAACSQGTMNNVLFGNENFGYYETVGGGSGAGPGFNGTDAIHHHMTNTAGTDPEILEKRFPVRLDRYEIRAGSGGEGKYRGGDGIVREYTFRENVSLSVLTQHRKVAPYGLRGGSPAKTGEQYVIRDSGEREKLGPIDGADLLKGDRFILKTPGGGGFGNT